MEKKLSLERLDRQFARSAKILGDCARLVTELNFNRRENMKRIAEALTRIYEVQNQIYEQRPDLTPEHLKEGWNRPRPGTEAAEDELRFLKSEAKAYKRLLERVEGRIEELEKKTE